MNRITPEERAEQIRRKFAEGVVPPTADEMMNAGTRRTPEKRELLRRLKQIAEERGQTPWPAKY
jgi:hypothetical protein